LWSEQIFIAALLAAGPEGHGNGRQDGCHRQRAGQCRAAAAAEVRLERGVVDRQVVRLAAQGEAAGPVEVVGRERRGGGAEGLDPIGADGEPLVAQRAAEADERVVRHWKDSAAR